MISIHAIEPNKCNRLADQRNHPSLLNSLTSWISFPNGFAFPNGTPPIDSYSTEWTSLNVTSDCRRAHQLPYWRSTSERKKISPLIIYARLGKTSSCRWPSSEARWINWAAVKNVLVTMATSPQQHSSLRACHHLGRLHVLACSWTLNLHSAAFTSAQAAHFKISTQFATIGQNTFVELNNWWVRPVSERKMLIDQPKPSPTSTMKRFYCTFN